MWTDSATVLQWNNSKEKQQIFAANRICKILEYTSQWNHVAIEDNPADSGTGGMSAEALQLSSWVKVPHFLNYSRFPFVPNKDVINNIKLGVNQAVTTEDTVSSSTSVKKKTTPFVRYSHLINLVLIKSTCVLLHTLFYFYANMPATVISTVASLTLLSLTKPSVISSSWCKENPLKVKEKISLNYFC